MRILAVALFFTGTASAIGIQVDVIPNFVGAGLGVTTQWMGSTDQIWGLVPGGRMRPSFSWVPKSRMRSPGRPAWPSAQPLW